METKFQYPITTAYCREHESWSDVTHIYLANYAEAAVRNPNELYIDGKVACGHKVYFSGTAAQVKDWLKRHGQELLI